MIPDVRAVPTEDLADLYRRSRRELFLRGVDPDGDKRPPPLVGLDYQSALRYIDKVGTGGGSGWYAGSARGAPARATAPPQGAGVVRPSRLRPPDAARPLPYAVGVPPEVMAARFERLIALVADELDVERDQILGKSRQRRYSVARHVAMFLALELFELTVADVGRRFGGRDHSSVLYARDRVIDLLNPANDERYAARVRSAVRFVREQFRE